MVNTNVCHAEVFAHQVIGHTNTGPAFPKPFSAAPPAVSTTTVLTTVNDYLKGNIVTPKKIQFVFLHCDTIKSCARLSTTTCPPRWTPLQQNMKTQ